MVYYTSARTLLWLIVCSLFYIRPCFDKYSATKLMNNALSSHYYCYYIMLCASVSLENLATSSQLYLPTCLRPFLQFIELFSYVQLHLFQPHWLPIIPWIHSGFVLWFAKYYYSYHPAYLICSPSQLLFASGCIATLPSHVQNESLWSVNSFSFRTPIPL